METLTRILTDQRTIPVLLIVAGVGALAWKSRHPRIDLPPIPPIGTTFLSSQGF